jgi:hypothetical protein
MDRPLFAYGTLCDEDLLAAVLGRPLDRRNVAAAVAPGFRIAYYPGRIYPALLRAPGGAAEGMLVFGLAAFDLGVLDAYEGAEYRRSIVPVIIDEELHEADTYLATATIATDAEPWSLAAWQANHKRDVLAADGPAAEAIRERLRAARLN